jgi:hypothetical protein
MAPELYTSLTVFGDAAYVYEHSVGTLTEVPLDGSAAITLSTGNAALDAKDTGDEIGDEIGDTGDDTGDTDDDDDDSSDSSGSSGSSATSSGYIFPNSSTKKLTAHRSSSGPSPSGATPATRSTRATATSSRPPSTKSTSRIRPGTSPAVSPPRSSTPLSGTTWI